MENQEVQKCVYLLYRRKALADTSLVKLLGSFTTLKNATLYANRENASLSDEGCSYEVETVPLDPANTQHRAEHISVRILLSEQDLESANAEMFPVVLTRPASSI